MIRLTVEEMNLLSIYHEGMIIFIHLHAWMSVIMEWTAGNTIFADTKSITFCHLSCG